MRILRQAATQSLFLSRLAFLLLTINVIEVQGSVIDFETTPSGAVPVDNGSLTDPYPINDPLFVGATVRFFFDMNKNRVFDAGDLSGDFEKVGGGDPGRGFLNGGKDKYDTAADGFEAQLGQWFLRQSISFDQGGFDGELIIDYDYDKSAVQITAFSGEIWDIDGFVAGGKEEQWLVQAIDEAGNVLASEQSPRGILDSLPNDGKPWVFRFGDPNQNEILPPGLDRIVIGYIGTKINNGNIGLAFNNFRPTAIPEVPSLYIVACIIALCFCWRCALDLLKV